MAACVAFALAGCGSTVQVRSTATVGQGGLNELGTTGGGVSTTTGGGTTQTPGTTGSSVPQGTSGTTGAAVGGVPTPAVVTPNGTTTTTGAIASHEPIKIGVITQPGLETAAKAFGLDGVTTGDTKAQVVAVVAWIRANGGLGGHPIQVVEYAIDMSQSSAEVWQTNACASMAEDHKVRFVVTVLASLQTLAACLAKHGIGLLADNSNFGDKTMAQYAPIMGNPSELGVGRMMTLLVDDLWRQGWLKAGSKIGVLALDSPDGRATTDGPFTAALRKHGLKPASTVYINPNNGDGGSGASGNAVLTFRASNVDRIIPVMYSPL